MATALISMEYSEPQEEPENTQFNERRPFFDKHNYIRKYYTDNPAFKLFINKGYNTIEQLYNKSKNLIISIIQNLRRYKTNIHYEYIDPSIYNKYIYPSVEFMCELLDVLDLVTNEDFLELKFIELLYILNDYQLLYITKLIDFDLLQELNYGEIVANYEKIYDINKIKSNYINNNIVYTSTQVPVLYDINYYKYMECYEQNPHLLTLYEIPEEEKATYKGKALHCMYFNEPYYKDTEHIKQFFQSVFMKTNKHYLSQLHSIKKKSGLMTIFENVHDITNNQIYYFIHILTDGHTSIQEKFKYILYYLNYEQLSLIGV